MKLNSSFLSARWFRLAVVGIAVLGFILVGTPFLIKHPAVAAIW